MIHHPRMEGGIQIRWGAKHTPLGTGGDRASGDWRSGGEKETTDGENGVLQYGRILMKLSGTRM